MDKIMSEYVITVHFHMKYTKIESFPCHKVCVCELLKFAPFHWSFIWGRVLWAKLMLCYLFILHMELNANM